MSEVLPAGLKLDGSRLERVTQGLRRGRQDLGDLARLSEC